MAAASISSWFVLTYSGLFALSVVLLVWLARDQAGHGRSASLRSRACCRRHRGTARYIRGHPLRRG